MRAMRHPHPIYGVTFPNEVRAPPFRSSGSTPDCRSTYPILSSIPHGTPLTRPPLRPADVHVGTRRPPETPRAPPSNPLEAFARGLESKASAVGASLRRFDRNVKDALRKIPARACPSPRAPPRPRPREREKKTKTVKVVKKTIRKEDLPKPSKGADETRVKGTSAPPTPIPAQARRRHPGAPGPAAPARMPPSRHQPVTEADLDATDRGLVALARGALGALRDGVRDSDVDPRRRRPPGASRSSPRRRVAPPRRRRRRRRRERDNDIDSAYGGDPSS